MRKIIVTVALALISLTSNAQLGILSVSKNDKQIPINFWYTITDDKDFANQMMYYGDSVGVNTYLIKLLSESGLDINTPSGFDSAKDPFWIVTYSSGYVTYIYLSKDADDMAYSWITTYSK